MYWGNHAARYYYTLWRGGEYVVRKVIANELLDRALVHQQVTVDLDWGRVRELHTSFFGAVGKRRFWCFFQKDNMRSEVSEDYADSALRILPLMRIRKKVHYDVSLLDSSGAAIHLTRRSVNRNVAAHIVVGLCISGGASETRGEDLYQAAVKLLETNDEKDRVKFDVLAGRCAVQNRKELGELLDDLSQHYIQCMHFASPGNGVEVIKFRSADAADMHSFRSASEQKPKGRGVLELLGIRASRFVLDTPELGEKRFPVHIRMVAPQGTMIDDALLVSGEDKPYSPSNEEGEVSFHHQRAIIFDRGLPSGPYRLLLKLNPKRSIFLVPAVVLLALQAALLAAVLFMGPERMQRQDSVTLSALFFIFPLLTVLIAREGEHEIMSRMLAWGRGFVVLAGGIQVVAGMVLGTMAVVGSSGVKFGLHAGLAFHLILIDLIWVMACLFLFVFQCARISAMRGVVGRRKGVLAEGKSPEDAEKSEKRAYRWLEVRIGIFTLIALGVLGATSWYSIAHIRAAWGIP